ncbi:28S ribosomal protein S7, mitochondrial [Heterocephalus glaber]|uniref:Small ribosomal subunit protein uS7m n=1 Tax=Heterocephalus glaber TaxID=10181 RepID=G5AQH5_HETGA|nr:28S ribosomal protein S7, mitochondrial [Heterocephalus glaber]
MADPVLKTLWSWPGLAPGVTCAVWRVPGPTQTELTEEEKYDQELKKAQLIKAAPVRTTCSVFADPVISKFTNVMMKGENKILARSLVTQILEAVKRKRFEKYHAASTEEQATTKGSPYIIFHQALKNCKPFIGLVPICGTGHFYQVPVHLPDRCLQFLAMKWMITECQDNKHRRTLMPEKLSHGLLQAFHNQGPMIKRKQDMHKMAEANRALTHYHW